jgi:hypothetical protein
MNEKWLIVYFLPHYVFLFKVFWEPEDDLIILNMFAQLDVHTQLSDKDSYVETVLMCLFKH